MMPEVDWFCWTFASFYTIVPVLGQSECSRGFLKVERSCIGIEQEIKVSKEEAEKTCKSVNKKAKLAALTKEEVKEVKKKVMKAGKNQGLS